MYLSYYQTSDAVPKIDQVVFLHFLDAICLKALSIRSERVNVSVLLKRIYIYIDGVPNLSFHYPLDKLSLTKVPEKRLPSTPIYPVDRCER